LHTTISVPTHTFRKNLRSYEENSLSARIHHF